MGENSPTVYVWLVVFFENMGEFSPKMYGTSNVGFLFVLFFSYLTTIHNLLQPHG